MAERVTTTEALKKLDAQLECSLCLDYFKQPKLLPCFHVFCKSPCLEKLVTKDGRSLTCPTCRHVVPLSERGVAGLQSDFHIDHLFEIRHTFKKAEDNGNTNCDTCEDGKATGYCNDCGDYLCKECQVAHKRVKYTKNHKLISLEELKGQMINLVLPKKATPNCPQHSENPLKIYCATCSTLICMDCTIRLHKDHNYDLVADVLTQHKEKLVSSLKPIKEKLITVQQTLKDFDTRVKAIYDQKAMIEADIHKEIDTQHALLDQRRAELIWELNMLTQHKIKALATQRDHVEMTEAKLSSCVEYAEGGLKTGTDGEVLEMKAPVLKRVEQLSAKFDPNTHTPKTMADTKLVLKEKEPLQQACRSFLHIDYGETEFSLQNSKITAGGLENATLSETKTMYFETKRNIKLKCQNYVKAEFVCTKNQNKLKCEVIEQQNGRYEITYHPVYRGKHKLHISVNEVPVRGSPFPITVTGLPEKPVRVVRGLNGPQGVVVNSKGQLIVADENGACVSVLTAEGEKIKSFRQLGKAFRVTVDQDDNVYVVDSAKNQVHKFSADGALLATAGSSGRGYRQFSNPLGICYNGSSNNLYVIDQWNHRIQVLTTDLKFVQCFGKQGSENGQFKYPKHPAFDSANNLYVTDYSNHRVQVFTADGQFLRAFSQKANGQKLKNPHAIAIDSSDTVYVSESVLDCVSVFTSQGKYINTIGKGGSEDGQFDNILGLFVDCYSDDSIIVSDSGNNRLQIF